MTPLLFHQHLVSNLVPDAAVSYGMLRASRKSRARLALIAKFIFCGTVPVTFKIARASIVATTRPTILPLESSNGPPLLPG
jgi:hypothetical protein